MEIRHLRTFRVAAELSSFTQAGKELELTQSAVSQQIAALEKHLGTQLFSRVGRQIELTDDGRRLHEYARRIIELVNEVEHAFGDDDEQPTGRLTIAASTVPAESILPALLAGFRAQFPKVQETLLVSDSSGATHAVEAGEADIGFVGELPRSSRLQATPIAADELVLVVAPNHRFAKNGRATIKQLKDEPLIVREPGSGSRRCVESALENGGTSLAECTIAMEVNSNEAIRSAVIRGAGVAFLSSHAVADDLDQRRLTRVRLPGIRARRQLYCIVDPQRVATAAVRSFIELVQR
jgi:DNA-binding transcriptional LysR family regulator